MAPPTFAGVADKISVVDVEGGKPNIFGFSVTGITMV